MTTVLEGRQPRRGTAAAWAAANPVLAQGEEGRETDTGLSKHGNGSTAWNDLSYDQDAANLINTPSGNLGATTVQGALDELQTDVDTRATTDDPLSWGMIHTIDPAMANTHQTINAVNRGVFMRVVGAETISKIGLEVGTSSGNICVAAYRNAGSGRSAAPTGGRLATSGSVACPASGYAEVSLGSSISLEPGDWLALAADNTTATFRCQTFSTAVAFATYAGRAGFQDSALPLPSTPSVTAGLIRAFLLLGVA